MIIFTSDRVLSHEQMDIFRLHYRQACEAGGPFVMPPGWKVQEIAVPVMAGPLVDYVNQLGVA